MSEENKSDKISDNNNENVEPTLTSTSKAATAIVMSLPVDSKVKSTESLCTPASKLKAPLSFSNISGPPSRIGRLCSQHNPKPPTSPPPTSRESIMNRESSSPSSTTYTDLYQETVRQFTRSSLSPDIDRNSPSRMSMKSRTSKMSNNSHDHRRDSYDLYLEATGRRRSSDHGAVLTADTEHFIIGQRVWVGGIRPGQIAYIGETHFAPGEWAGIVLDEPNGKNDGCVAGKRYFQCEAKRGIFSRLTRLTMMPLSGANTPTTAYGKFSPERSMTISPTASLRSSVLRSPTSDRVIVSSGFGSRPGILRYLGETQFASGNWCGVELDEASGKNDGSVDGIRYFECKAKYGVFVPIAKVSLSPSSKKTRLSRTGSRESLTSIGTMNSIATTNTSRMRMNAQRKLSTTSTKLSSVPKAQFSMQDLLRDKQNHVEQLMIERDMDREDAQNQALNFQKNINELKLRINQLEVLLSDERKKTEDLQFSIDEATFCGDEYSAQSQYFKEKIHKLEQKLKKKEETESTQATASTENSNEQTIAALNAQILQLNAELTEKTTTISKYENNISILEDDVKQRQSSLEFLQNENETLLKELRDKDENLEKFTLSTNGLNNMQKEMLLLKQEYENERKNLVADYAEKLHAAQQNIKQLTEDMAQARLSYVELEANCTSLRNECDVFKLHSEKQAEQLVEQTNEMQKISAELIMLRAENSTLDELLKTQKQDSSGSKTALDNKNVEMDKLKQEIGKLIESKNNMEINMKSMEQQVEKLKEAKNMVEAQLQQAHSSDSEKAIAMQEQFDQMQQAVLEKDEKIQLLTTEIDNIKKALEAAENAQKLAEVNLFQKHEEINKLKQELQQKEVRTEHIEKALEEQTAFLAHKQREIEELSAQVQQQNENAVMLQNDSANVVQQLTGKINELQAHVSTLQQKLKTNAEEMLLKREEYKQQAKELIEKNDELQHLITANASNEQLLIKIRQEYDDSQRELEQVNQQLAELQAKFLQQQMKLQEVNNQFGTSVTKCETLAAQNVALEKQHESGQDLYYRLQNELKTVQEELRNRHKQQEQLQHEANAERLRFEAALEEYQQQIKNLRNQLEILENNLKKLQIECHEKQQLIIELEENTVKKELALSDVRRQLENVQSKYDALQAEKLSLQQDLLNLRTSSSDTGVEIVKMTQDLRASEKAYETLLDKSNAERAALESEVEANRQKIDALCKQLESLTQELKTMTAESLQCKQDLQAERSKCEKLTLDLNNVQRRLEVQLENINSLEAERAEVQSNSKEIYEKVKETEEKLKTAQNELIINQNIWLEAQGMQKEEKAALQSQLAATEQELEQLKEQVCSERTENELKELQFYRIKSELQSASKLEVEKVKVVELEERKRIKEHMEAQIKALEQNKQKLDEAVVNMQNQIKLLQDELLKSQLDFKAKEEDMSKQLLIMAAEKKQLQVHDEGLQNTGEQALVDMAQEKATLSANLEQLKEIIAQRDGQLQELQKTVENLAAEKLELHTNASTLENDVKKLLNELEMHKSEMEYKLKLGEADTQKINDLKQMLETLQLSHAKIAATNAELSSTLALLEQEKFETAHIFELFEMESDQNAKQLLEKLSNMKQQLSEAQVDLLNKETELTVSQKSLESISLELQNSHTMLKEAQTELVDVKTQLQDTLIKQQELQASLKAKEKNLQAHSEILQQLEEYKKIVEEMSDAADEKTAGVEEQKKDYKLMTQQRQQQLQQQKTLKTEYIDLQRKYESMEAEKLREIKILQERIKELQSMVPIKHNGGGDSGNGDALLQSDNNTAQINFLNSIIADMQKKNDTLKAKIEALEMLPTDYTKPKAFDFVTRRKPAPRVFCDICDEFDKHETEDCPMQASEDFDSLPLLKDKERTFPEPRKYCESCEVFGHDTGECGDECF